MDLTCGNTNIMINGIIPLLDLTCGSTNIMINGITYSILNSVLKRFPLFNNGLGEMFDLNMDQDQGNMINNIVIDVPNEYIHEYFCALYDRRAITLSEWIDGHKGLQTFDRLYALCKLSKYFGIHLNFCVKYEVVLDFVKHHNSKNQKNEHINVEPLLNTIIVNCHVDIYHYEQLDPMIRNVAVIDCSCFELDMVLKRLIDKPYIILALNNLHVMLSSHKNIPFNSNFSSFFNNGIAQIRRVHYIIYKHKINGITLDLVVRNILLNSLLINYMLDTKSNEHSNIPIKLRLTKIMESLNLQINVTNVQIPPNIDVIHILKFETETVSDLMSRYKTYDTNAIRLYLIDEVLKQYKYSINKMQTN